MPFIPNFDNKSLWFFSLLISDEFESIENS